MANSIKGGSRNRGGLKVGDFVKCKLKEPFKGFSLAPLHQEKCTVMKITVNYVWVEEYPKINWTHDEFFASFNQYNDEDDQGE